MPVAIITNSIFSSSSWMIKGMPLAAINMFVIIVDCTGPLYQFDIVLS